MKEDGPQRLFSEVLRSLGHVLSKDWWFKIGLSLRLRSKWPFWIPKHQQRHQRPQLRQCYVTGRLGLNTSHPLKNSVPQRDERQVVPMSTTPHFDMFLFLCDDTVDALQRFTELQSSSSGPCWSMLLALASLAVASPHCLWILLGMLETCWSDGLQLHSYEMLRAPAL